MVGYGLGEQESGGHKGLTGLECRMCILVHPEYRVDLWGEKGAWRETSKGLIWLDPRKII